MLIADVGDVLIGTRPGAHYRELAALTGLAPAEVESRIEDADLPGRFERGTLNPEAFAARVRHHLSARYLRDTDLWDAWRAVIGEPVPAIVVAAAALAYQGRLVLASNTNPCHWPVVCERLTAAGLPVSRAAKVLSFEVGFLKPEAGFFHALARHVRDPGAAVIVDDRACNVEAARGHGLDGWIHADIDATVARIDALAVRGRR